MGSRQAVGPGIVLVCALLSLGSSGCLFDDLVVADAKSFSRGPASDGRLHEGTRLPAEGRGYWIPPTWSDRGLNYGIDELVAVLVHVGRQLDFDGLRLSVGDLSPEFGGRSRWHRSHQTGRDVDLLFFAKDEAGKSAGDEAMYHFNGEGLQVDGVVGAPLRFDVAANWKLVAALLDNPVAEVQYIFIQDDLRQSLLEYADAHHVDEALVARAAEILRQPGDSAPHDDHMHVRIFCPKSDRELGCVDHGMWRWHKKDEKYAERIERLPAEQRLPASIPMPLLLPR